MTQTQTHPSCTHSRLKNTTLSLFLLQHLRCVFWCLLWYEIILGQLKGLNSFYYWLRVHQLWAASFCFWLRQKKLLYMNYNVNMLCWYCLNNRTHLQLTILMLLYSMQSSCCEPKLYGTSIDWISKHKHFLLFSLAALKKAWFYRPQSHHYGRRQTKADSKQTCFPVCIFLGDQPGTRDGVVCCAAVWKSIWRHQQKPCWRCQAVY